ncbi:DinB family protein [Sporosarcina globispora]|uniref:DinB family protein n=1 Tax=Sporosarcina globispora TaxID=1459 RepID=UPI0022A8DD98|nr:DinB family protein [Sporosarcina globispora]
MFFERLKELPKEIYDREIQSVFSSIAKALVHIYKADTIWLGVMQENSMEEIQASISIAQKKTKDKSVEEMEKLFQSLSEDYQKLLNNVSDLDKEISSGGPNQYSCLFKLYFKCGDIDYFYSELVLKDETVNHFFKHTDMEKQRRHQAKFISFAFGLSYISFLVDLRKVRKGKIGRS